MTDGPVYLCQDHADPDLLALLREMLVARPALAPVGVKSFNPTGELEILMAAEKDNADIDVVAAGRAVYAELQSRLEATDKGSFVVIDVASGDYEVNPNPTAAKRRLKVRQPGAKLFERRIGRQMSYKAVSIRRVGERF